MCKNVLRFCGDGGKVDVRLAGNMGQRTESPWYSFKPQVAGMHEGMMWNVSGLSSLEGNEFGREMQ